MQNPRKRADRPRKNTKPTQARVIDLRTERVRRRVDTWRRKVPVYAYVMRGIAWLLFAASIGFIALGLIPSTYRVQSILWSLFCALLGMVAGLWLNAMHDRLASRTLRLTGGAFALACVAGLCFVNFGI